MKSGQIAASFDAHAEEQKTQAVFKDKNIKLIRIEGLGPEMAGPGRSHLGASHPWPRLRYFGESLVRQLPIIPIME